MYVIRLILTNSSRTIRKICFLLSATPPLPRGGRRIVAWQVFFFFMNVTDCLAEGYLLLFINDIWVRYQTIYVYSGSKILVPLKVLRINLKKKMIIRSSPENLN